MTTALYTVFHLNLAFSSIEKGQHAEVVQQCYWPILDICKDSIPIGIEMTAYTLEAINAVDPDWVAEFKDLLLVGKCELIGSGDSQIIGPLVPDEVNRANLALGQDSYQNLLGVKPTIAYVNEQAVSSGLLDIYIDAGFEAVVVEWDNPFSHNPDWKPEYLERPQTLISASGRTIKVIWNHAIAFQKFQRYVHGELTEEDYLLYLKKVLKPSTVAFPVYGSDAEVFDFRPGRYQTEDDQASGEWQRIKQLFNSIKLLSKYHWECPSKLLQNWQPNTPLRLTNPQHPVSVKKQAKYNISRWGLSGRNDLILNTLCFQNFNKIKHKSVTDREEWRDLCRLWSSDLRTHLTQSRYEALNLELDPAEPAYFSPWRPTKHVQLQYDEARRRLYIKTPQIHLSLNGNRGLAIDNLAFVSQDFKPVIGTLSHGFFDHISYGADFYTNHLLLERFRDRDRVTDLNRVKYQIAEHDGCFVVYCHQALKIGKIIKWFKLDGEKLHTGIIFEEKQRPEASIRLGFITLLDCEQRAWYQTRLGSSHDEFFQITEDMDQGKAVSSLVSSASALGATNGAISIGSQSRGINITWRPDKCAALPMISSKKINRQYLNRLFFSLAEADETLKPGGHLLDFTMCITPTMRIGHA